MKPPVEENPNSDMNYVPPAKRSRRRWWYLLLFITLLAAGWYVLSARAGAPGSKKGAKPAAPPTPVFALPARKGDVGIYLNGLGSVTALNTVTVKSRIEGQLMEVFFREGQTVQRGIPDHRGDRAALPHPARRTAADPELFVSRGFRGGHQLPV